MGYSPKYTRKSIIAYVEQIKKQIACATNEPHDWVRILGGIVLNEEIQDKVILRSERELSPFQWGVESESFLINGQFFPSEAG